MTGSAETSSYTPSLAPHSSALYTLRGDTMAYTRNILRDKNMLLNSSIAKLQNATMNLLELQHERETEICNLHSSRKVTTAEIVACFIAVLTVFENIVILTAITKGHRSLRKPPYWFIASLAVADFLTGCEVILAVFVPIGENPSSRIALKGAAVVTFIASINSLLLVSLDRYIRIVRHTDYKRLLNKKKIIALILASWIISIVVFLVIPLLKWSCSDYYCCAHDGLCTCMRSEYGDSVCGSQCSQSFVPFTKSYLMIGVIYFTISVVVMTTFYSLIFKVVKEKTFCGDDNRSKRREVQLAKTLVITLGIFVICWLPVQILFIVDLVVVDHSELISKAFDFALIPSVINSFMNPIIYSVRLPHMRVTIKRIFLPCLNGDARSTGSTWISSTSMEKRSFRRLSGRRQKTRQTQKSKISSSSGTKSSPPIAVRERPESSKSLFSDNSVSNS